MLTNRFKKGTTFFTALLLYVSGMAQLPVPDFTATPTSGCSPLVVQFTDRTTGNPTFWNWDLGNGQLSTAQNPTAIYSTPGTYTVTLVARNAVGINSVTKTNFIVVNPSPTVTFTANNTLACLPATIQFTDQSVPNAGTLSSWLWDFGDGTTSTAQNPSKTYSTIGFYSVRLTVSNSTGCTASNTFTNYIRVVSGVTPDFSFTPPSVCRPPFAIGFTNLTTGPGTLTYSWDFGNATVSTQQNPTATYAAGGNYTITLTATSQFGCSGTLQRPVNIAGTTTAFTSIDTVCINTPVNFTNSSSPAPVSTVWDFGNGRGSTRLSDTSSYQSPGNYSIKLVNNYGNCTDSVTRQIHVRPLATASFTAPQTISCRAPFTVNFQDTSPDAVSWLWDFGDGGTSTLRNPAHTYTSTGIYTVRLTVTDSKGCSGTVTQTSFVRITPPIVNIANAPTGGCAPFAYAPLAGVTAIDGISSYFWDFGDGFTSTAPNPVHTYPAVGSYTLKLVIVTNGGCTDSVIIPNGVRVGNPPATNFSAAPLSQCAFGTINFTDLSTGADSWAWNFGDGNSSSLQNPTHTYRDTGFFNVTLTAVSNGCPVSLTRPNYVHILPPISDFSYNVNCNNRRQVIFASGSITNPAYGPVSYFWEFGDIANSTSTLQNPVFTYPTVGTYTVRLTVTNGSCSHTYTRPVFANGQSADFTLDKTVACRNEAVVITAVMAGAQNITNFAWSIDGAPYVTLPGVWSSGFSPNGPHSISLVITDVNGCRDTVTKNNVLNIIGPTANFNFNGLGSCRNQLVTFNDLSAPSGGITQWQWNFGDGQIQTFNSPPFTHSYADTGRYTVRLRVRDTNGCFDSVQSTLPVIISKPSVSFGANTQVSCAGAPIQFSDSSQSFGASYFWDFGDGVTSTLRNPQHSYPAGDRQYSVKLVITDTSGCQDSLTRVNYITIRSPRSAFTARDTTSLCPPLETKFTFQGSNFVSYYWDFGDGATSTLQNPNHFYNNYGVYTAKLFVVGGNGCIDSSSVNVTVSNAFTSTILSYSPTQACNEVAANFNITTPPQTRMIFYSGDGFVDSSQTRIFTYTYRTPGLYNPSVFLTDSIGCRVGVGSVVPIRVIGAVPLFGMDKKAFCDTGTVLFGNFTIFNDPIVNSVWDFGDGITSTLHDPAHRYTTPGTYLPTLTVTTQSGCVKSLSDTVRVYRTPVPVIAADSVVCINERFTLTGSLQVPDSVTTWSWDLANGSTPGTRITSTQYGSSGTYNVRLTARNALGCQNTTPFPVRVPPLPVITVLNNPVIPLNTSISLPVTYSNGIQFYQWSPGATLNCTTCAVPVATPRSNTTYTITATDSFGCVATNQVTVTVICNENNFFIPNTFSPNGDGNNDIFYPRGSGVARIQTLKIFNRWGNLVYERRNFAANDPSLGWNGMVNGRKAEMDTYVYYVEFVCENSAIIPFKGNVTLIR